MELEKNIFRGVALDTISKPEQLDQQAKIITPKAWMIMAILLFMLGTVLIWAFLGIISDGISVTGTIFPHSGVTDVFAFSTGISTNILVKEGDFVDNGDILVITPNDALLDKIETLKKMIAEASETQIIKDYNIQLQKIINEYESTSVIKAPTTGTIQSIVSKNEVVNLGSKVSTIINEDRYTNDKEIIAFVPLTIAKKIKIGMEAQVSPVFAPREEFGYMKGYVTSIGNVPVTEAVLEKIFGNWSYADHILNDSGSIEVRITLGIDPNSINNFQWSNKKGQSLVVDTCTICDILIIAKNKRPIDLLLNTN